MIKHWKRSFLISAICFGLIILFIAYVNGRDFGPGDIWIVPFIVPFYGAAIAGIVMLTAGIMGGMRNSPKIVSYILLAVIISILLISWGRLLFMLKIW